MSRPPPKPRLTLHVALPVPTYRLYLVWAQVGTPLSLGLQHSSSFNPNSHYLRAPQKFDRFSKSDTKHLCITCQRTLPYLSYAPVTLLAPPLSPPPPRITTNNTASVVETRLLNPLHISFCLRALSRRGPHSDAFDFSSPLCWFQFFFHPQYDCMPAQSTYT